MQFTQNEVAQLIRGCRAYQRRTGSEELFDECERLIRKLENYAEEYSTDE